MHQIQTIDAAMSSVDHSVVLMIQATASFGTPPAAQTAYPPRSRPHSPRSWHRAGIVRLELGGACQMTY